MNEYIDAEQLKAEIERRKKELFTIGGDTFENRWACGALDNIKEFIASLQQEKPIKGKQVVIVTETDGDANIHWDCRSLDDVKALLASAQSFIADKQVEELRGQGSGPDYNTTEGRFRNAHKFQQEQPDVDLTERIHRFIMAYFRSPDYDRDLIAEVDWENSMIECARHFYELGLNARGK